MTGNVLGVDGDLDLDEIWECIDAADRWIGGLFDAFEALARTPGMGHKREDLTEYPVLFWPVGSCLFSYRAGHRPIGIVAVTQCARDIAAFLRHRLHRSVFSGTPIAILAGGLDTILRPLHTIAIDIRWMESQWKPPTFCPARWTC